MPSQTGMFGPRGCWARPGGPVVVADTGNHRVLIWRQLPRDDVTPPDLVLGQPDFTSDDRNRGGSISPRSLFVPTGVLVWQGSLIVADAWNHRVLLWQQLPQDSDLPADIVLGQTTMYADELNRGGSPRADTLYWPAAVCGRQQQPARASLERMPSESGQPADLVLGQLDFTVGEENGGGTPNAASMRWPHSVVSDGRRVLLADAGNNRVLLWHDEEPGDERPPT